MKSFYYDNAGLLVRTVNHDGSSVVYAYDELNERIATVRIGAGQTLDFDPLSFALANVIALDKYIVVETTESTENTEDEWWKNTVTVLYKPGENVLTASVYSARITGLTLGCNSKSVSVDADGNTTVTTESLNPGSVSKVVTTINTTLGMTNVSHYVAGHEICSTNSLGGSTHIYDGFARRVRTANSANGRELESVTTYHDDGSVATVGEVTAEGTNTTSYSVRQSVAGKLGAYKITVTDPAGSQTVNCYSNDGQLYRSEGATYPVAYVKNPAGQMAQLHTWRDENGDPDITRWYYDLFTGAVTNKLYADGNGTVYSYYIDGRIASRLWARNITTTYGYADNATGSMRTTEYSDSTPSVTNCYNLSGQLLKVEDGTGTTTFGYDSKGRVIAETNDLAVITRSYDKFGRYIRFTLTPLSMLNSQLSINYDYDIFNRLSTITAIVGSGTNLFTYSYLPGTQLVSGYSLSQGGADASLTVSRTYEPDRDLISSITNTFVSSVPFVVSSFNYSNDSTGKRTSRTDYYNGSTVTNTFGYNKRSEVTNAVMNSSEQSLTYDDIGNRLQSTEDSGQSSVTNLYSANQLNQYTSVSSVPSVVYPRHDDDGNMTWDGSWHHIWNAENRPVTSIPGTVTNGACMFEYSYNHRNLRVEKIKKQLSGRDPGYPMSPLADPGTWDVIETRKYVWDGV
jgi:YD repeat-containing protein